MDEKEYNRKYIHLRILKSVQEYLKSSDVSSTALYPIRVPDELLYRHLGLHGAERVDELIHQIFKMGLSRWSEELYQDIFGSQQDLEDFIELVKNRNRE
jgi:hypothetical protein